MPTCMKRSVWLCIALICLTASAWAQNEIKWTLSSAKKSNCEAPCADALVTSSLTLASALEASKPADAGREPAASASAGSTSKANSEAVPDGAVAIRVSEPSTPGVEWKGLILHSNMYLGVMHVFRIATEPSTRIALHNSVVGGYFKALGAMHGWSDGDGYYENYLGHPIEGAASAYLWINHDRRYAVTEFGSNRDYWKSRLRAFGYAWAFSEQFEVGPISEASIGQIQRYCCAYGFVDHVITPTAGLAWVLGEDIIDKYVVRGIENHSRNRAVRMIARVGLNPPESFANIMSFRAPWHRENRPGVLSYDGDLYISQSQPRATSLIPTFELATELPGYFQLGDHACLGGSAVGALRLNDRWQWTLDVGGCSLQNLGKYWSGDLLTFTTGPQWIAHTRSRWTPHAHLRVGGEKATEEYVDPVVKQTVLSNLPPGEKANSVHDQYAKDFENTGFSLHIGGGIDVTVNRALAVRVGSVDYDRSWLGHLNGIDLNHGLRISTGLVLRVGTW